jgi:predicted O-methyltransferase YrrM
MALPQHIQKNWKRWALPWIPPALLDIYRRKTDSRRLANRNDADFSLPKRAIADLFPGCEAQIVSIPTSQINRADQMVVPAAELLALAAICRSAQPRRVFEIGTYTGSSTLIMAINTPAETEVFTLDIDPADRATHQTGLGVGTFPEFTVGSAYRGAPAAEKIQQFLGSSRTFDFTPFYGTIDLVFVDADHTYEFVKADTATAFKLLRPGGIIIWDDYRWEPRFPECAGVTRCLNELALGKPVFQLDGARFAIYVDANGPASKR